MSSPLHRLLVLLPLFSLLLGLATVQSPHYLGTHLASVHLHPLPGAFLAFLIALSSWSPHDHSHGLARLARRIVRTSNDLLQYLRPHQLLSSTRASARQVVAMRAEQARRRWEEQGGQDWSEQGRADRALEHARMVLAQRRRCWARQNGRAGVLLAQAASAFLCLLLALLSPLATLSPILPHFAALLSLLAALPAVVYGAIVYALLYLTLFVIFCTLRHVTFSKSTPLFLRTTLLLAFFSALTSAAAQPAAGGTPTAPLHVSATLGAYFLALSATGTSVAAAAQFLGQDKGASESVAGAKQHAHEGDGWDVDAPSDKEVGAPRSMSPATPSPSFPPVDLHTTTHFVASDPPSAASQSTSPPVPVSDHFFLVRVTPIPVAPSVAAPLGSLLPHQVYYQVLFEDEVALEDGRCELWSGSSSSPLVGSSSSATSTVTGMYTLASPLMFPPNRPSRRIFDAPRFDLQLNEDGVTSYNTTTFLLSSAKSKKFELSTPETIVDNPCLVDYGAYASPSSYQPLTGHEVNELLIGNGVHAAVRREHFELVRQAKIDLNPSPSQLNHEETIQDEHWQDLKAIAAEQGYELAGERRNDWSNSVIDPLLTLAWHAPLTDGKRWANHIFSGLDFATIKVFEENNLLHTCGIDLIGYTNPTPPQQGLSDPPLSRPYPPDLSMPDDLPTRLYLEPRGRLTFLTRFFLTRFFDTSTSPPTLRHSHANVLGRQAEAGLRQTLDKVAEEVARLGWGELLIATQKVDVPHLGYRNSKGRIGPGSQALETIWVHLDSLDRPFASFNVLMHPGAPANPLVPRSKRMFGKCRIADGALEHFHFLSAALDLLSADACSLSSDYEPSPSTASAFTASPSGNTGLSPASHDLFLGGGTSSPSSPLLAPLRPPSLPPHHPPRPPISTLARLAAPRYAPDRPGPDRPHRRLEWDEDAREAQSLRKQEYWWDEEEGQGRRAAASEAQHARWDDPVHGPQRRAAASEARQEWWDDPVHGPRRRAAASEARQEWWSDPDFGLVRRAAASEARQEWWSDPDFGLVRRAAKLERELELWNDPEGGPLRRAAQSERSLKTWNDPDLGLVRRTAVSEAKRGWWWDADLGPSRRAAQAATQRARWADPVAGPALAQRLALGRRQAFLRRGTWAKVDASDEEGEGWEEIDASDAWEGADREWSGGGRATEEPDVAMREERPKREGTNRRWLQLYEYEEELDDNTDDTDLLSLLQTVPRHRSPSPPPSPPTHSRATNHAACPPPKPPRPPPPLPSLVSCPAPPSLLANPVRVKPIPSKSVPTESVLAEPVPARPVGVSVLATKVPADVALSTAFDSLGQGAQPSISGKPYTPPSEKPFKCEVPGCGKAYKGQNGLKYHRLHGPCGADAIKDGIDPRSEGKPYMCHAASCGKRYKRKVGLLYHYEHAGTHGAQGLIKLRDGTHPSFSVPTSKRSAPYPSTRSRPFSLLPPLSRALPPLPLAAGNVGAGTKADFAYSPNAGTALGTRSGTASFTSSLPLATLPANFSLPPLPATLTASTSGDGATECSNGRPALGLAKGSAGGEGIDSGAGAPPATQDGGVEKHGLTRAVGRPKRKAAKEEGFWEGKGLDGPIPRARWSAGGKR